MITMILIKVGQFLDVRNAGQLPEISNLIDVAITAVDVEYGTIFQSITGSAYGIVIFRPPVNERAGISIPG